MGKFKIRANGATALSSFILGSMLSTSMAFAQENTVEDTGFTLEEITVTARKMEEKLLNAPVAVTAISGMALEERDMTDISAVADIAPNVNFSFGGTSSGSGSAAVVYIRGVGQNDFTPVTDPGVGIYVDGVYMARTVGSVLDIVDLASIEIVRGPQGTLFGRNTIGGAISLTTRDPGDEFSGRMRATGGEDNRVELFGSFDVPMSDSFRASFTGLYKSRDGYVERVQTGEMLGDDDVLGGRAKFVWDASEDLTIKLSVDASRERTGSAPEVSTSIGPDFQPSGAPTFVGFYNLNIFGNGPADCAGGGSLSDPTCANNQYALSPYETAETGPSHNDIDQWGLSLTADWSATDSFSVKTITAYRELDAFFSRSSDGTPFMIFQTTDDYTAEQFTQEIQFNGTSLDDRLNWVAGAFYMKETASDIGLIEAIIAPAFPRYIGAKTDNKNFAVFAEATYDLSDRLHATGGLRYTDETKKFDPVAHIIGRDDPYVPAGEDALDFSEVTWRGTLAYDVSDEVSTYFNVSKGFKSGGFDQRLTQPVTRVGDDQLPTFAPEKVTAYEFGLKAELPDQGLRLALAAFYSDYTNIQVSANPPGQINTVTVNAAEGSIKGIEAEFTWVPTPELFIQGALGYQDAKYTTLDANKGIPLTLDDELIRTPEFSWNLGASYRVDLGENGSLTPRVDWVYKSEIQFEPVNNPLVASDAYHNINMALAYADQDEKWRLTFGVNNLTNETYMIAGDSNATIGYALSVFSRPRNWYVSAEFAF